MIFESRVNWFTPFVDIGGLHESLLEDASAVEILKLFY